MSNKLRIALCQMSVGSVLKDNLAKAAAMVSEACGKGAELVVLPECFDCPYGTKHFPNYAEVLSPGNLVYDTMAATARDNKVWLVAGSVPERADGKLYNTSLTFDPHGQVQNVHRKVHLFRIFTETVRMDEGEVLTAGDTATTFAMRDDLRVGVGICFDVRYPQLAAKLSEQGTSLLVYPGAFNMATGPFHWQLMAQARAIDNQQFVVMCSPARDASAGYVAYAHSVIVDPWGTVLADAGEGEALIVHDLDLDIVQKTRQKLPILSGTRRDLYDVKWGSQ